MTDTVQVLVVRGNRIERRRMKWDHQCLVDRRNRETYRIMSQPRVMKTGSRWSQVFFAHHGSATTVDLGNGPIEINGQTTDFPQVEHGEMELEGKKYKLTPELVFELAVADDIRAYNQAGKTNVLLLALAAGSGAALMVFVYMIFQVMGGM